MARILAEYLIQYLKTAGLPALKNLWDRSKWVSRLFLLESQLSGNLKLAFEAYERRFAGDGEKSCRCYTKAEKTYTGLPKMSQKEDCYERDYLENE